MTTAPPPPVTAAMLLEAPVHAAVVPRGFSCDMEGLRWAERLVNGRCTEAFREATYANFPLTVAGGGPGARLCLVTTSTMLWLGSQMRSL